MSDDYIGVIGFGTENARVELVTKAVARAGEPSCHLLLIGQPGPASKFGRKWRKAADEAGCVIEFTGEVEVQEVSRALSMVAFLVFADKEGPTPRRTTLAAALAYGKAVVAVDGRYTWEEFRSSRSMVLAAPTVASLTSEIRRLRSDAALRSALGARASNFYRTRMSAEVVGSSVSEILRGAIEQVD
jgi:glycosyltransferase involved in cell wall biosynthesis